MTHQKETNGKLLSDAEAKEIWAREAMATLGPWFDDSGYRVHAPTMHDDKRDGPILFSYKYEEDFGQYDGPFIAHARTDIPALLSDREARIQRNREGIEKMFAKMCELDTPKRGELHLLLISLFS